MDTLKTILYFSIFNYPLKLDEICDYSRKKDRGETSKDLDNLIAQQVIIKVDDYYLVDTDLDNIEKRKKGNLMAAEALKLAKKKASLIAQFPFVQAVGVSGSLSKGYYDENSDIDFFVITTPNKVWLCRTLLMLYKKAFLLNSRKYFCINYFMSAAHLEVEEKNRFTATEVKTLIPFQGKVVFSEFYNQNRWVYELLGEFHPALEQTQDIYKAKGVALFEKLLQNDLGNSLDSLLRKLTVTFWKRKFNRMAQDDFNVALKSTNVISKHHPQNFQKKVITRLNEKYEEIKKNHNIELQKEYV